jgi:hypothetical protein
MKDLYRAPFIDWMSVPFGCLSIPLSGWGVSANVGAINAFRRGKYERRNAPLIKIGRA